ncbi:MAG: DinB family protein, partial [Chloroflexota bacterium]
FSPMQNDNSVKSADLVAAQNITFEDLRETIADLYDTVAAILKDTVDHDITFVPHDPEADDPYAAEDEQHIGWTIGHIVAHLTASNEETAVFASLLARGIPQDGRIRTETPWEEIDTVAKAQSRLEESQRIVLAYLDAIPDNPDFETTRVFSSEKADAFFGPINALASMVMGLSHHVGHIDQLREAHRQAKAATTKAL